MLQVVLAFELTSGAHVSLSSAFCEVTELLLMQTSPECLLPGAGDLGLRLKALPGFHWPQGRLQVLCTTDFSWDGSYCPVCA